MPVYNEYHTIESCLERVLKADVGNLEMEVIISDNNSNDGTKEILHKISDQSVKILYRKENNGKVANIKNALKEASGDLTLFQDGDLEYSPNDYLALLELFFLFSVDVVYGSRLTRAKATAIIGFPNYIGNILFTFFANFLFNKIFTDIATGSKVFKKNIIKNLEITSDGFEIEPEITAKYLEIKKLRYLKSQLQLILKGMMKEKKLSGGIFLLIYII
jgi:glycosyltransferase involved in cell wall biosynthesis